MAASFRKTKRLENLNDCVFFAVIYTDFMYIGLPVFLCKFMPPPKVGRVTIELSLSAPIFLVETKESLVLRNA